MLRKNVHPLVWLALLISGITARTGCAQTLAGLQIPFQNNDNFLLAAAETDDDYFPTSTLATAAVRPNGCDSAPVAATPLSLEPTATDRNSDQATSCFGKSQKQKPELRFALSPVSPCSGWLRIQFASACPLQPALGLNLWNSRVRLRDANAILLTQPPRERFHTRAALLQSLGFLMLEHGFRFAADPYL